MLPSNSPTNFAHLYENEKVTQNEEEEDEEAEQNVSQTKRAKRDETRRLKTEHRKCNNMATGRAYCPLSSVLMWRCVASLLWSGLLYNKHLIFKRPSHVATSSLPSSVCTLVVPSTFCTFTRTATSSFICRCSFAFCPLSAVAVNRFAITYNVPSQPQLTWPYTPCPLLCFFCLLLSPLPFHFMFSFKSELLTVRRRRRRRRQQRLLLFAVL